MDKSPEVPGQGLVDVKSNGSTQTVLIQNAIVKLKDMEEISEDIGSEIKDKMEGEGQPNITSPNLITNCENTTPKNSSSIMTFP